MTYKIDCGCKWIILKYVGPIAVLLQSLVLGTIVGWPIVNIPVLLSPDSPVQMTTDEVSWMMAFLFFGSMLSPVPSGCLMDRYGRKTMLLYLGVLPVITWSLVSISTTSYQLWLSWFCAGVWSGVVYTVAPVYLGEIATPKHRGFINTIFSVTRRIGIMIQFVLGRYLPFHSFAVITLTIPMVTAAIMSFAPESPYYHLMNNDRASAQKALYKLRGKRINDNEKEIEDELNELELFIHKEMKNSGRYKDLITIKTNRKTLLIMETIVILLRMSETGSIMGYIMATLPEKVFQTLEPSQCVLIIEVVRVLTSFVSSLIIDKLGRKTLMICASVTCGVSMLATSFWYYLNAKTKFDVSSMNWVPFVCLLIHNTSYCFGLGPVCSSLRSEYFPTNVKAKLTAITSTTFALVSCMINKTFLTTADSVGVYLNYWIFAISCFLNALFTLLFVIETKGKTLKQIQDELNTTNVKNLPNTIVKSA